MVCASRLLFAFFLIKAVIRLSPGNEKCVKSRAIEEGAKAYLKRQVDHQRIAVVICILLFFSTATALGFLLALCSLAAGYIGMRIAVLANTRNQAATQSHPRPCASRSMAGASPASGRRLARSRWHFLPLTNMARDMTGVILVGWPGLESNHVFARLGGGIIPSGRRGRRPGGKNRSNLDEDHAIRPRSRTCGRYVGDCPAWRRTFLRPTP